MFRPSNQFRVFSVWLDYFWISIYYHFMYLPDIYSNWVPKSALVCFIQRKDFEKIFYSGTIVNQK